MWVVVLNIMSSVAILWTMMKFSFEFGAYYKKDLLGFFNFLQNYAYYFKKRGVEQAGRPVLP
jgi:hypothetical protein